MSACFALSFNTPVTSVARCITFERCKTNGDSGTFVEEQNGARASATDLTAYSCSSKSFEDLAKEAASAKSRSSFPLFLIVPAKTLDVTSDLLRRTNNSGVAPTNPSTKNSHVDGYSISSRCNKFRISILVFDVAFKSRASTTFSSLLLLIAAIAVVTCSRHLSSLIDPFCHVISLLIAELDIWVISG